MTEVVECRNKWENQCIKKKNRKRRASHYIRKWRKTHGRSSNSCLSYSMSNSCIRQNRMINMKYNKAICNHVMNQNDIYIGSNNQINDDIISFKYNPIPIWICSKCRYRNIERETNCKICNSSYSSMNLSYNQYTVPMTLDQFCENIWDSLSIPVWICSKCTYCNIEQSPNCQMCHNQYLYDSYSYNNCYETEIDEEDYYLFCKNKYKTTTKHKETTKSIEIEWSCTQCTLLNAMNARKCILCDFPKTSKKSKKLKKSNKSEKHKYDITVRLKLNTNCWRYGVKSFKVKVNEIRKTDTTYYGLSECNLTIQNTTNNTNICYSLIPSTSGCNNKYKSLSNVIIPINYNRYYHDKTDNNPLKSITSLVWSSGFNRFNTIKPKWNNPDISRLKELNFYHILLEILVQFIPSYDICKTVLFQYVESIQHTPYSLNGQHTYYKRKDDGWYRAIIVKHKKPSDLLSKSEINTLSKSKQNIDELQRMEAWYIRYNHRDCNRGKYRWVFIEKDTFCSCEDIEVVEDCHNDKHILSKIIESKEAYDRRHYNASRKYMVEINGSILLNKDNINIKNEIDNKIKLFMTENNGKLPFKLYDTKLSTIQKRNYHNFECFEIGFDKNNGMERILSDLI